MALDYKSSLSRYRRYLKVVSEKPLWKASLFTILSLALIIVMVVFALRPTLVTIASLGGQIKQQQQVADKLRAKIATVQVAGEQLDQAKTREHLLATGLPILPEWEDWADRVTAMASESGVQIVYMTFGEMPVAGKMVTEVKTTIGTQEPVTLPEGVAGISFSITVKGEYLQVKQLAAEIEALRRLAILSNIQVDRESDGSLVSVISGAISYFPKSGDGVDPVSGEI